MKRIVGKVAVVGCAGALALTLAGCGPPEKPEGGSDQPTTAQEQTKQEEKAQPLDLTGEWTQSNKNSEDSYQIATISGETITINWVSNGGDTKSLYWAGSYVAPATAGNLPMIPSRRTRRCWLQAMRRKRSNTRTEF